MDWTAAIERNREALRCVLAALVAMAGVGQSAIGTRQSGPAQTADSAPDCPLPIADCLTLPRHLHRAILRLLRPAEAAARRLVIVAARDMHIPPPCIPPHKGEGVVHVALHPGAGTPGANRPKSPSPLCGLRGRSSDRASDSIVGREGRGDCEAIGGPGKMREAPGGGNRSTPRYPARIALPLTDPLPRWRRQRPAAGGVPRISLPGFTAPHPVPVRLLPAPDDRIDATRLALRLAAVADALADLPRHARRFARWQARNAVAVRDWKAGRPNRMRRFSALRPGRPPGQRPASSRHKPHEIHEVLADMHWFAAQALAPDTS